MVNKCWYLSMPNILIYGLKKERHWCSEMVFFLIANIKMFWLRVSTCLMHWVTAVKHPPHWHDTGSWNPPSSKIRTCLFYIVNIMGADVLATQGARASATMIFTVLSCFRRRAFLLPDRMLWNHVVCWCDVVIEPMHSLSGKPHTTMIW